MNLFLRYLLSLLWFSVPLPCDDTLKTQYLELRTLNYRYVQKYKQYLKARSEGLVEESLQAEREFRKAWAEYLKKVPDPAIMEDPNGYYSRPGKLGFNPLEHKPLNDVYRNFPTLHGVANPKIFKSTEESVPTAMNIDSSSSANPVGSGFNILPGSNLTELEFGAKGKKGNPPGLQNKQNQNRGKAERLARGRDLLSSSTENIGELISEYSRLLNEPEPNLTDILALREYISSTLGRLHQLDGAVGRLDNQIRKESGEKGNAPVSKDPKDQKTKSELYKATEKFQTLMKQIPNPFALLTSEQLESLFSKILDGN